MVGLYIERLSQCTWVLKVSVLDTGHTRYCGTSGSDPLRQSSSLIWALSWNPSFKLVIAIIVVVDVVESRSRRRHHHHRHCLRQWRSQEVEVEGAKSQTLLTFPLPFLIPSPPLRIARGQRERCKLPQRGLGRSPSRQRFWCILDQKGT